MSFEIRAALSDFSGFTAQAGVLAITLTFLALLVRRAVFTPLRHVPVPFLCRVSDLPAIIMAFRGRKALWTHSLFLNITERSSVESMKIIYGGSWVKSEFYDGLRLKDKVSLLGVRDDKKAGKRPKAVENAQMTEDSVDVFRWYRLLAFDIIADLAFEHKFKMLEQGAQARIVDLIHATITYAVARTIIPGLPILIALLGTRSMYQWKSAEDHLEVMGEELYLEHMAKPVTERGATILSVFQAHYVVAGCDTGKTAGLVASEASALLIAGSDATSMTLVYLTYLLALNPHIRERIQAELDAALSDRDHLLFVNELDRLQYLGVVIKETLRLHPAVSGDLPRWVPGGGAVIDGFFLPGKTVISCQPYSMNRIPDVFGQDSDSVNPDRFIDEAPAMKQASFAFSYGPRNCAGMNLANSELKIVAAYVFRRYKVTLAPETTPASMVPTESFFTAPIAMATRVQLHPR